MLFQEGYVYHIKDDYFQKVQDDKLMRNKEGGAYRPTFFCMRDQKIDGLLWVVPMSSRTEKFQAIMDKQVARYGRCLTIVIGEYDGRQAAFLIQNMFPVTEKYLDHIHTRNGNPVPVRHSIARQIRSNATRARQLVYNGKNVVFPDIRRLENLMRAELQREALTAQIIAEAKQEAADLLRLALTGEEARAYLKKRAEDGNAG